MPDLTTLAIELPETTSLSGARVVARRFVAAPEGPAAPGVAIPLTDWLALADSDPQLAAQCGPLLFGDDAIAPLEVHITGDAVAPALVAIDFPKFADGRGYSHSRRLRTIWGYEGPIVATGDVLRDQLLNMARCGVTVFHMHRRHDPHRSLEAFRRFTEFYQYA